MYYIGKGTDSYENYEHVSGEPGAEDDDGVRQASGPTKVSSTLLSLIPFYFCRLVKSGTDFRDLSELILELEDTPPGSVRRKIIASLRGDYLTILIFAKFTPSPN